MSARLLLIGSAVVAAALVLAYVALGGGNYRPPETADPCEPRPFVEPQSNAELGERLVIAAIDGAACEVDVSREQVLLAFSGETGRERLRPGTTSTTRRWRTHSGPGSCARSTRRSGPTRSA